jgi:hypothetical protein
MSDALLIALVSALINGAVTWGIISTKLAWLRRDVDQLARRVSHHLDRRDEKTQPADF